METLLQQIEECKKEISSFNDGDAELFRIKFLGTKGIIKNLMTEMKQVPNDQKKEFGQLLNALKLSAEEKLEALKQQSPVTDDDADDMDSTLPGLL